MKKLYAVRMGADYRGRAEGVFGLPGGRKVPMSKFAAKGDPKYAYAEVRCTAEEAQRFAADTGLTVTEISETELTEVHPFAHEAEPVTDEEAAAINAENRAARRGHKKG